GMPSPEQGREPPKEESPYPAYSKASRFEDEATSRAAYIQLQEMLLQSNFDLSVYRMQLDRLWHVAVLGDTPPVEFDQTVQAVLSTGQAAELPTEIILFLNQRRLQARSQGSWVER